MKSILLASTLVLSSVLIPTQNALSEDSIWDGTLIGGLAGAAIGVVTKGDVLRHAAGGALIGGASDYAYNDDIEERRILVEDQFGNVYYTYDYSVDTDRDLGKRYGYVEERTIRYSNGSTRSVRRTYGTIPDSINLDTLD